MESFVVNFHPYLTINEVDHELVRVAGGCVQSCAIRTKSSSLTVLVFSREALLSEYGINKAVKARFWR